MREIPLTRGMVALVDDADYERVAAFGPWQAHPESHTTYARRSIYLRGSGRRGPTSSISMHGFILGCAGIDHRNCNGLDNQRRNLRVATHNQNMGNKRLYRSNTSGFKGVILCGRRWRAVIKADNRPFHLGYFDTPEQAAQAYDVAALEHFGEFARLNFPAGVTLDQH